MIGREVDPRGVCRRIALAAIVFVRSLRVAATSRSLTDLGDHQLRDIGLSRLDCARSLVCVQGGLTVQDPLAMFLTREVRFLPVGSTDQSATRFPAGRPVLHVLSASPRH